MFKILLPLLFIFNFMFAQVDANLEIIKKANVLPKIFVSVSTDSKETITINKLKEILQKDFKVSGHFDVASIDGYSQISYEEIPDIVSLNENGVDLYLHLWASKDASQEYTLNTKLYDLNSKTLIQEKSYTSSHEERYPFLAHRVAISINDFFKAPSISWMDRFVIFSKYVSSGKADIFIADYTLTFQKRIISGGLNIFPKWGDAEQKTIYFTSYNYDKPTLVKLNIFTGQKEIIMQSDGMIVCSDVNKSGDKLLITASPNNQPDIYLYNLKNKQKTKVTKYSGIDVGGQFVENDTKIVFVSDRLGSPNIFAKYINETAVERLVFHSRNNSSATTFEDKIVYSSKDDENEFNKRSFNLYLMSTRNQDLRRLTLNGINQFPKFSRDGESLLFIKNFEGVSSLGIIRLNFNNTFLFPLNDGNIQSIDW